MFDAVFGHCLFAKIARLSSQINRYLAALLVPLPCFPYCWAVLVIVCCRTLVINTTLVLTCLLTVVLTCLYIFYCDKTGEDTHILVKIPIFFEHLLCSKNTHTLLYTIVTWSRDIPPRALTKFLESLCLSVLGNSRSTPKLPLPDTVARAQHDTQMIFFRFYF